MKGMHSSVRSSLFAKVLFCKFCCVSFGLSVICWFFHKTVGSLRALK
jgi:hypothetical protein